ncbi:hypothetical protein L218DRAFT_956885 [Marasmius fiardii PR-910]|nr:hypothetical protein L218DRAFT_956885 [Marasmius fiardii PR-910]
MFSPLIFVVALLIPAVVIFRSRSRFRLIFGSGGNENENESMFCWTTRNSITHHKTFESIQQLLDPGQTTNIKSLLLARAIPNERLIRAFGLGNTFVTPSTIVRDQFRRDALGLLGKASRLGWTEYLEVALEAVRASLPSSPNGKPFDEFIQVFTLRVVLIVLLQVSRRPGELDDDDLRITAELISELWEQSKTNSPTDTDKLDRLNFHLRRLLVCDIDAFPNPLDIVIPAWETLWRVVATTVAYVHDNPRYREAFDCLRGCRDPARMFSSRNNEYGCSAQSVITEVLRLHPPSRRIHRATHTTSLPIPQVLKGIIGSTRREVADIESYHRLPEVWGESCHKFDPTRHEEDGHHEGAENRKILAFGFGRLQCPARKWAPMAAAMAAAAVLEFLELDSEYVLVKGGAIGSRKGWEGWKMLKVDGMEC